MSHRTHLEGEGARFPTTTADFSRTHPSQAAAGWHLQIDTSDPTAGLMTAGRLTLKTSQPRVAALLDGTEVDDLLMRTIRRDVIRQLLYTALHWDEVSGLPVADDATAVAGVLRNLLARIWSRYDPRYPPPTAERRIVVDRHRYPAPCPVPRSLIRAAPAS